VEVGGGTVVVVELGVVGVVVGPDRDAQASTAAVQMKPQEIAMMRNLFTIFMVGPRRHDR
jgi:hypothetical protein